jgi:hypothetical protein
MRLGLAVLAAALAALMVSGGFAAADISDPGSPRYTNSILGGFVTPTVAPGQTVEFSFNVTNPYGNRTEVMANVTLVVGIYMYSTQEKAEHVDSAFPHPPLMDGLAPQKQIDIGILQANQTTRVEIPIETSKKTPHGSYFSQSTYFVRFNLTFNFVGNDTPVVLKSRGWFTEEQWNHILSLEGNETIVNRTYMKSLGVDGLLPDSSFGIKIPIPRWPLGVIVAGAAFLSFMALYYFVLDNPGRYPRLEKRFYYLRGKLNELRSKLEHRRRK